MWLFAKKQFTLSRRCNSRGGEYAGLRSPPWIDGKHFGGVAERQGDIYDPATGQVSGHVDFADVALVDEAVSAAKSAFGEWRNASWDEPGCSADAG